MVAQTVDGDNTSAAVRARRGSSTRRRTKLTIAGMPFGTKKEAQAYTKTLIDRQPLGQRVGGDDHDFLCDLLTRHPEADEKIGAGIGFFRVREDPSFPRSRQLVLRRVDGSDVAISWHRCVTQRDTGHEAIRAMREAVMGQVLDVKQAAFASGLVRCPRTGEVLAPDNCHVDHTPPLEFWVLMALWLAQESLTLADIAVRESPTRLGVRVMSDARQRTRWQVFHARYAQLRVVSVPANLMNRRKATLVELGQWALEQGRDDLVALVTQAIQREHLGQA